MCLTTTAAVAGLQIRFPLAAGIYWLPPPPSSMTSQSEIKSEISLIRSVSNSSPVHVFEPLFWTGQLLDNFWLKHQANISGMDEAALFKNHFSWINF